MILKLAQFKYHTSKKFKNYLIKSINNKSLKREVYEMILEKFNDGESEVLVGMRFYEDDEQLYYALEDSVQYRRGNGLRVNEVHMCFIFNTVYDYIKVKTKFMHNIKCELIEIGEKRYFKVYKK